MIINAKIAVIIVNWKKYDLTNDCINSVLKNSINNLKIILVDNEYNNNKLKAFKSREKIDIIKNKKNEGFSKANNLGIDYAIKNNFDYILLLNNDAIIENNLIKNLIEFSLEKKFKVVQPMITDITGEKIWNSGGKINKFFGTFKTNYKGKEFKNFFYYPKEIDWFTGCCCLFQKDVFIETGLLDENFFAYYEDVDYSMRLKNNNIKIGFFEKSRVFHHGSMSSKSNINNKVNLSPKIHYLTTRNHIYLIRKHLNKFNLLGVIINQFLKISSYSIYFILRFRFTKINMLYKGLFDAFKV